MTAQSAQSVGGGGLDSDCSVVTLSELRISALSTLIRILNGLGGVSFF